MTDLTSFYTSLLNIGNTDKKNEIEEIVIRQREELYSEVKEVSGFCKYIAGSIYNEFREKNIRTYWIDLMSILGIDHVVLIAEYRCNNKMKRILVDPTFEQFNKKEGFRLTYLKEWPSEKIENKDLVKELLEKGFVEIDSESFSQYLRGFTNYKIDCNLDEFLLGLRINKNDDLNNSMKCR